MKAWLMLAVAISAEVVGTTALKASDNFSRLWPSVIVVLSYGLAFYLLSETLKVIPVGIAYAIWAGGGIVLITLVSWWMFDQKLDWPALLGIALILSGVVVLNVFSRAVPH